MGANRSVFSLLTRSHICFRSWRKLFTLFSHALSLVGPGDEGQYPLGNSGDLCFASRENSRMSHWAMRRCSTSSHGECSAPGARLPRRFAGRSAIAWSKVACASPPSSSFTSCCLSALSFCMIRILLCAQNSQSTRVESFGSSDAYGGEIGAKLLFRRGEAGDFAAGIGLARGIVEAHAVVDLGARGRGGNLRGEALHFGIGNDCGTVFQQ